MSNQAEKETLPLWMKQIAELATELTGVQLGDRQKAMLASRLEKRFRELKLASPEDYLDYVRNNIKSESTYLTSLLTTHHTFFFREFTQFEYLAKEILPKIIPEIRKTGQKKIRVWSAACSQGQEVYSLAMFLDQQLKQLAPDFDFEILGTDVDPDSVQKGKNGVYRWNDIKEIPLIYLDHWARGTAEIKDYVKAKPTIKKHCRFEVQNLLKMATPKPGQSYDVIFCRNVFIYFTKEQIKTIMQQMLKYLSPHGHFFVGVSESLMQLDLPISAVSPSVYSLKSTKPVAPAPALKVVTGGKPVEPAKTVVPAAKPTVTPQKIRVVCVDDSSTILTLLKKVLVDEFEVVGTAKSGLEAKELVAKTKFDVMTLDIHMPGQGGLDYLKTNMNSSHPPVVMVSSVPREDSQLAFECLQLGANDYIEKPAMSDLAARQDEIRTKIRCAAAIGRVGVKAPTIDRSFQTQFVIKEPQTKLRIILCGAGDRQKLASMGAEFIGSQPPTVVLLQGAGGILPSVSEYYSKHTNQKSSVIDLVPTKLEPGSISFGDTKLLDNLKASCSGKSVSLMVLGDISQDIAAKIKTWPQAHLVLEDLEVQLSKSHKELVNLAKYFVPYTSMAYHSNEFLSKVSGGK